MRVVVTGGAGFIGANLCRYLTVASTSLEVVAFDDLSTGHAANLDGLPVNLIVGSILDERALNEVVDGAAAVVHLAARPSVARSVADPVASNAVNTAGTVEVLQAATRHEASLAIVASSSSVYGANPELPKHERMLPMPMSPYAVSKLATEQYALAWQHSFGLQTLAFRFFNVYGPLQPAGHAYAAVIPAFVDAALRGVPLPVQGTGLQSRDFTYVDTVCSVISQAIFRKVSHPGPVNLAFGTRTSLIDLIALLEARLDRPLDIEPRPARPGDVPHSQADNSLLRQLFPDLSAVSLEAGLEATIEWMSAQASQAQ